MEQLFFTIENFYPLANKGRVIYRVNVIPKLIYGANKPNRDSRATSIRALEKFVASEVSTFDGN